MRRHREWLWSILGAGVVGLSGSTQAEVDHGPYDELLKKHVRNERVDYLMIRKQDWGALPGYLDSLADVDVDKLAQPEQLVFYINLYNATVIQAVVERYHADACMECGCCAYECPAQIPLVQLIRVGKVQLAA